MPTFFNRLIKNGIFGGTPQHGLFDKKPRILIVAYFTLIAVGLATVTAFNAYFTHFINSANLYDNLYTEKLSFLLSEKLIHFVYLFSGGLIVFAGIGLSTKNSAKRSLIYGAIGTIIYIIIYVLYFKFLSPNSTLQF